MFDQPLFVYPYLRPMVWGGRQLGSVLGKSLPDGGPYGESWEVSDHPIHSSRIRRGALAGQTLRDLMCRWQEPLLGHTGQHAAFPLLVKFLDAKGWLSVQVHPDDEKAPGLCPGEGGKTEAWFILDAQPGSRVYAGLKPGVDPVLLREALERGTVAGCLHSFEPQAGDCLFLKAGTVHACGGGVLLAEVQQTSDATFRLFDWNRRDAQGKSRPLHVEQGLACINWDQGPVDPLRLPHFREPHRGPLERIELVSCPHFELACLRSTEPFAVGGTGKAQVLTVIHRTACVGTEEMHEGDTCLFPAALPRLEVHAPSGVALLLTTVPS